MEKLKIGSAKVVGALYRRGRAVSDGALRWFCRARVRLADEKGQGTTEYAILVGVLTKLDSVLARKHEVRGLPCFR